MCLRVSHTKKYGNFFSSLKLLKKGVRSGVGSRSAPKCHGSPLLTFLESTCMRGAHWRVSSPWWRTAWSPPAAAPGCRTGSWSSWTEPPARSHPIKIHRISVTEADSNGYRNFNHLKSRSVFFGKPKSLRGSVADPDPGSGAFFDPWIRMGEK